MPTPGVTAPILIKGDVSVCLSDGGTDKNYEFPSQNLTAFGVGEIPSSPLSGREHFGKPVEVVVQLSKAEPLVLVGPGRLFREYTAQMENAGVRFEFPAEHRQKLSAYIKAHGTSPSDYTRKHPRIPADPMIATYPLRALAGTSEGDPVIFEVRNLSPSGILLSTENPQAKALKPGEVMEVRIEPRGKFTKSIKAGGMICRVIEELQPKTKNILRSFGVQFSHLDESNRAALLELIKDVITRLASGAL